MFPTISQYAVALEELTEKKTVAERKETVASFVRFLERRREGKKLPLILKRMIELADEKAGIKKVTAVTAHQTGSALTKKLERKAAELFPGKKIDLDVVMDPAVIGGVNFKTKEEMYDTTLATALKEFTKEISR